MHRRHANKNIPIELLRALVTIVDTGSYTKAADALDLTQSAISSQIARLGQLLGGSIFARGHGNITPTNRGTLALQYARRMLTINDELLAFAGPNAPPRQLVIGLPAWLEQHRLIEIFGRCSATPTGEQVSFRCDRVERLLGDLNVGSIDIAYLCNVMDPPRHAVARWSEKTFWVKSPRLSLGSGAPIPLISWPGTTSDRVAVELLQQNGMRFFVAFSAPDFSARLAAVAAGLGVLAVSVRNIIPGIEIMHEGMPGLPENKAGIFVREGLDYQRLMPLLEDLVAMLAPQPLPALLPVEAPVKKLPRRPRVKEPARPAPLRQAG